MPAVKDILIQGGKQQKVLEMTYKKKDGSVVKRKVEPYELRGDTLWAWDVNDGHIKRFVIWRIRDAKVTKDEFEPRFDIKMSKAGGVTLASSLEITLNGLRGLLNESGKDLDEVHSIRRELIVQMRELTEHEEKHVELAGDIDLTKLPDDMYELPDTAGILKVGEPLTKQIHGAVYRMRRIEHKRFGTVYAVWYRTYPPAYFSKKDGLVFVGGDGQGFTGEVKKKVEWMTGLYDKIYKLGEE